MTRARRLSGKELLHLLERRGFVLVRVRGSHHLLISADGTLRVTVPVHSNKTLAIGTASAIMKDAGLRWEDLDEE